MARSKPIGTSFLFVNNRSEILLVLRDDIPQIRYPNMWDIPGGTAGENETPEECITREIEEELGLVLTGPVLFEKREFQDRVEFTFWQRADFDVEHIRLTEGQRLAWFSEKEAKRTHLAFDFNITIDSFFTKAPFRKQLT